MPQGTTNPTTRIALIGVGQVGGAAAYTLILSNIASELLLVDTKTEYRDAQVADLSDVAYSMGSSTRVRSATHHDAGQCDIVVITAGSKTSYETSIQRMQHNIWIVRNSIQAMTPCRSDTIILDVSNPVDLITTIAQELSNLPKSQVFGSGTFPTRFDFVVWLLTKPRYVPLDSVQLSVVGVHGESEVAAWSSASIEGAPTDKLTALNHKQLEVSAKKREELIIREKGAVPLGIGAVVASICKCILQDSEEVHPISQFQPDFGCCFSLPVVLGRKGIINTMQIELSDDERTRVHESARELRDLKDRIRTQTGGQGGI